jgi:hypothetical protein
MSPLGYAAGYNSLGTDVNELTNGQTVRALQIAVTGRCLLQMC